MVFADGEWFHTVKVINMKYKFFGLPVPYKGKPIWEIVGNLKNFGVGRMIVSDEHKDKFDEPTFYRIVKVQPMDNPTAIGHYRSVLLWAELVLRGKKMSQLEQLQQESQLTKFHLVPKEDEVKYMSGITDKPKMTVIPKFQSWPPLYKKIWEQRMLKKKGKYVPIPALPTTMTLTEKSFEILSSEDIVELPLHSDLCKTDVPVEELLKKVWTLRNELGIPDVVRDDD